MCKSTACSNMKIVFNKEWQIEKVAAFCGLQLNKVPRVEDIEHEVDEEPKL